MSLIGRTFKPRQNSNKFYCPLCRSERGIILSPRPTIVNYLQIFLTSICLSLALYPFMKHRSFFVFFIVWGVFEFGIRYYCRKEIPCPYCGFDATWYKKDVKVARELVEKFWQEREELSEEVAEENSEDDDSTHINDDDNFNDSLNDSLEERAAEF